MLYTFLSDCWGWLVVFFVVAAEAVGMWESVVLGFPHFHGLIVSLPIILPKPFHLQFVCVKASDWYRRKVHSVVAIIDRQHADALSIQDFAEKHGTVFPVELAVLLDTPHLHRRAVLGLLHPRRKQARGTAIDSRRRLHVQRLVRTHLVVLLSELVEGPLLGTSIGLRWQCCRFL